MSAPAQKVLRLQYHLAADSVTSSTLLQEAVNLGVIADISTLFYTFVLLPKFSVVFYENIVIIFFIFRLSLKPSLNSTQMKNHTIVTGSVT
jgi:hypothetical protein